MAEEVVDSNLLYDDRHDDEHDGEEAAGHDRLWRSRKAVHGERAR